MKKVLAIALLLSFMLTGCGTVAQVGKSIQSEVGTGLPRRITVFAMDGSVIDQYEGQIYVETAEGNHLSFLENGKRINLSGNYIIEEL